LPWALATVVMLTACGSVERPAPHLATTLPTTAAGTATPTPAQPGTVFVVVMENTVYEDAVALPYAGGLARQYAIATDYQAVAHPSLPNYLALTSGSTHGITDDGYHPLPAGDIGQQLTDQGISWRAYMEGMTHGCMNSPYPYAVKHNPFAYYGGGCPDNVVPLTALDGDLESSTPPRFVWITPDLCNDGHDCDGAHADRFLSQLIPKIIGSDAWKRNGVLFLTWDEGESGGDNHILTVVAAPNLTAHATSDPHDHYSTLRTVEDLLGVPPLGAAASAAPFSELLPAA
jgi:phospholipase C